MWLLRGTDFMNRSKILKTIMISTALMGGILTFSDFLFKRYLKNRFNMEFSKKEASSVAIIGGSDGPTAVFLTSKYHNAYKYIVAALLFSISAGCFLAIRKKRK